MDRMWRFDHYFQSRVFYSAHFSMLLFATFFLISNLIFEIQVPLSFYMPVKIVSKLFYKKM